MVSLKAKELAELLLQHPDFDVQGVFCDNENNTGKWPEYKFFDITGIADIGFSAKTIILSYEKTENN